MSVRILCVGDLHLGRPVRLPDRVCESMGIRAVYSAPEAAWRSCVDAAIQHEVDAVLFTGDVADGEYAVYAALGALDSGIRRLNDHGVPTYGVAGNHDSTVFGLLAQVAGFTQIGHAGNWELVPIGKEDVALLGWSFNSEKSRENPLEILAHHGLGANLSAYTVIGMLHCDRDVANSAYAPVTSAQLAAAPGSAFLLGHIHKVDNLEGQARPVGYLGSVVGLDPTETGPHGPWLMEIEGGNVSMKHLPLAPIRWERSTLSLSGMETSQDCADAIYVFAREQQKLAQQSGDSCRILACRISVTGEMAVFSKLSEIAKRAEQECIVLGEPLCFVERVTYSDARPILDIAATALGTDLPGGLAADLLALEAGDDSLVNAAMNEAQRSVLRLRLTTAPELTRDETRALLISTGRALLAEMLAQHIVKQAEP